MKPDQIAALIFGFIFVSVMLVVAVAIPNPTVSQMFVFRVVLSLAAGGIGAVIPGFLSVNVSAYVRAGGAMALLVLVYLMNPPSLAIAPKPNDGGDPYSDTMRRGDQAFSQENYPLAQQFYQQAAQLKPDSWEPRYQLGRVEARDGKFALSLSDFRSAFDKEGRNDGSIAYGIAETEDTLGQDEAARQNLIEAQKLLPTGSPLLPDVTFDLGLTNLELWLAHGIPNDTAEYGHAELAFKQFLEAGAQPVQWALYSQACLRAGRSEDRSLPETQRRLLSAQADEKLENAVVALAQDPSEKAPYQRHMMRTLLGSPSNWDRKTGEPPACPALLKSWTTRHGSLNTLLAKLPAD